MGGRNTGICHSCRSKDHFFADCPKKRRCQKCKNGFEKCFVVEKQTVNKGRLFICCSEKCGFWEWVVKDEASNQASGDNIYEVDCAMNETVEEMSRTFQSRVRLTDEEDIKISVNVTICKANGSVEANAKGKGLM